MNESRFKDMTLQWFGDGDNDGQEGITDTSDFITRAEFEQIRKAQSGSDRKVAELSQENARLKSEIEGSKRSAESRIEMKEKLLDYCSENNLPYSLLKRFLDSPTNENELFTLADEVAGMIEDIRIEERNDFAGKHGRTVTRVPDLSDSPKQYTIDELNRLDEKSLDSVIRRVTG